MYLFADM